MEKFGLFDKKMKNNLFFKGGIEAVVAGHFALGLDTHAHGNIIKDFTNIKTSIVLPRPAL
jgi:hypothetical protein